MYLKILEDNNTYIDAYYLGEPAVSYYIEIGDRKILFDTGYSDAFIKNAKMMGINLSNIDTIVFSHGHNDHTRGLQFLSEQIDLQKVRIIAHPECFYPKRFDKEEIGAPFSLDEMKQRANLQMTEEPICVAERLCSGRLCACIQR